MTQEELIEEIGVAYDDYVRAREESAKADTVKALALLRFNAARKAAFGGKK